jgi:hypothetical protein
MSVSSVVTEDTDITGLRKLKVVERVPQITDLVSKSPFFWNIPLGLWWIYDHLKPWRWDHCPVSKHQTLVTQQHIGTFHKNGNFSCTAAETEETAGVLLSVVKYELNLEWKHLINLFGLDYYFICRLCIKCRSYKNWNGIDVDGSFHFWVPHVDL